ncbi:MAG: DUF2285 domain-containing protein [Hyphomonadaceae bacterium]
MFWSPRHDTSAVVLETAPAIFSAKTLGAPEIDDAFALRSEGDAAFLYDLGGGQRIQLINLNTQPAGGPVVALVPLGLEGFDRIESIGRLLAALHGRSIPPDTRLTHQQRGRLRRMLQCFDGHRDGATQQEIAQIVFRTGPLDRHDWQKSSARHAIKSLLRDARLMIAGGYRTLLRHRRQT